MTQKNKFLILVDNSYFKYFIIFGAVSAFQKQYPDEAAVWIKPADETDQNNLPNLLNSQTFKRILKQYLMKRLETIDSIARQNFQNELDAADSVDIVFACDDKLKRNFRLELYPQYKANRLVTKHQYNKPVIKDYIENVLYEEIGLYDNPIYSFVRVEGAEGDDIIATALMKFGPKYMNTLLIASDHDFLQIEGVHEFDLFGKEAKRTLAKEEVSADEFLLGKILMGDKSDNIKQVIYKCGPKTALKFVRDKDAMNKMLAASQESADRYELNRKIISFKEIPTTLSESIERKINETLYREAPINSGHGLRDFMEW